MGKQYEPCTCASCAKLLRCSSLVATLNLDGLCGDFEHEPNRSARISNQLAQALSAMVELAAFRESSPYRARTLAPVAYAASIRALRAAGVDPGALVDAARNLDVLDLIGDHPPTRHCDCEACRAAIPDEITGEPRTDRGVRLGLAASGAGTRHVLVEELANEAIRAQECSVMRDGSASAEDADMRCGEIADFGGNFVAARKAEILGEDA